MSLLRVAAVLMATVALSTLLAGLDTDEVRFLVWPAVALVEASGLARFEWESGLGYLSRADRFAVTRDCAGLRFLAVSFALFACAWTRGSLRPRDVLRRTGLAAVCALFATSLANAARIAGALWLRRMDWRGASFGFDEAHRLESVLVYLVALAGVAAVALLRFRRPPGRDPARAASIRAAA